MRYIDAPYCAIFYLLCYEFDLLCYEFDLLCYEYDLLCYEYDLLCYDYDLLCYGYAVFATLVQLGSILDFVTNRLNLLWPGGEKQKDKLTLKAKKRLH